MATLGGAGRSLLDHVSQDGCFLTDAELEVYVRAFQRTGTRGAFNWYRALDLNWEDARGIPDPTIRIPALMITAENDPILRPALAEPMPKWIPGLRTELIRRCSHWTQQERPAEVNRLLLEFLADLR
jgi:pimeloyl-ACP methyl ester carboxylesterase